MIARAVLTSMRPKQWYKNFLLFVGIAFSQQLGNFSIWPTIILAFSLFCALSGSVYMLNDIKDLEKDKLHPRKKKRPIASGQLSKQTAKLISFCLMALTLVLGYYFINVQFFFAELAYMALTFSYSLWLKNMVLVDVIAISGGFVIRAMAGVVAISVSASPWLIICTFMLALFLALGKRRHELIVLGKNAGKHRLILAEYTPAMLDQMISITTSVLLMSYSMYTFLATNPVMMLTIPFAIFGLFRYIQLIHIKDMGSEPERIFRDRPMVTCLLLWGVSVGFVFYWDKIQVILTSMLG